jgi:metal-responsive CopG/Arc/MetJ family transcriptional regulator
MMAIDKEKNTQILVTFPNKVVEEIERYWHDNKLKNRSETIRELVKKGLKRE